MFWNMEWRMDKVLRKNNGFVLIDGMVKIEQDSEKKEEKEKISDKKKRS